MTDGLTAIDVEPIFACVWRRVCFVRDRNFKLKT